MREPQSIEPLIMRVSLKETHRDAPKCYALSIPAIRELEDLELHPHVTVLVGDNGSGKSTLLEAIAVAAGFNAEGGSINFRFATRSSESDLSRHIRLARGSRRPRTGFFFRAESFFNVATEIERLDSEPSFGPPVADSYGRRPLHEQSHGESFLALILNRFGPGGLYLLDEPEAALSPARQVAFTLRMRELVDAGSQFIVATHSPIITAYPGAFVYELNRHGIGRVRFDETEQYLMLKAFFSDPDAFMAGVMRGERD